MGRSYGSDGSAHSGARHQATICTGLNRPLCLRERAGVRGQDALGGRFLLGFAGLNPTYLQA